MVNVALNVNTSIVDYLKSQGKDSSFNYRTTLATQNGISNYRGTAQQNVSLLNALRNASKAATTPATQAAAPQAQAAPQAAPQTQTPAPNQMTTLVNSQYDNQLQSQLSALQAARDRSKSDIDAQKTKLTAGYTDQRNQTDVVSTQNVNKLREIMASSGLMASGENVSANVSLMNARQSALNNLNLSENQEIGELDRQVTNLYNPNDEASIRSEIEAQRNAALLSASQFQTEQAWREHQFNNMSASEKAQIEQNAKQFGEEMAWKMYDTQYQAKTSTANNQALINFYKTGKV